MLFKLIRLRELMGAPLCDVVQMCAKAGLACKLNHTSCYYAVVSRVETWGSRHGGWLVGDDEDEDEDAEEGTVDPTKVTF